MYNASLANKYAQATLNSWNEDISYEQVKHLKNALGLLSSKRKALSYLTGIYSNEKALQEVLLGFFSRFKVNSELILPLIKLLAAHKRLSLLLAVLEAVVLLYKKKHEICTCIVTSTYELTNEQKKRLTNLAQNLFCKRAEMCFEIDEKLIAGIKIQSNNRVWEKSVAKQLRAIRSVLNEVCGGN